MRSVLAILAVAVASASAASLGLTSRQQQLPTCSSPCFAAANLGGCQPGDYHCLCQSGVYIDSVNACLVNLCFGVDLQDTITAEKQICTVVGVSITNSLPTPTASSTSGSTSSTTTPASAKSSNAALTNGETRKALTGVVALVLGALAL